MTQSFGSPCVALRAIARPAMPLLLALVASVLFVGVAHAQNLTQIDIPGPAGSETFGANVTILPNGNFVVVDPLYDAPGAGNVGAVSLYDGHSLTLISRLTGSSAGDLVGSGGVTVLANSNFVVGSPNWDNGAATNAGAATWVNGALGLQGVVSPANSLVGSNVDDAVSLTGITALTNGNYVVGSWQWQSTPLQYVGAATWGNGATGTSGPVSASNSLIGSTTGDFIGLDGVTALPNGNYVVVSTSWRNGSVVNAGAVTWADGGSPLVAEVSASNSLVGGFTNDSLGSGGIVVLPSGNFLVRSPFWNNGSAFDAGALTWVNGDSGLTGLLSDGNSLVGLTQVDRVGATDVTILTNGNYVATTLGWDNGVALDAGAVTWGSGTSGVAGKVDASNSLVGSTWADLVGNGGVVPLANGNYVVVSRLWDFPTIGTDVGAVTWRSGTANGSGVVNQTNSLVGISNDDWVGSGGVVPLTNGNYVVVSPSWNETEFFSATDAGAVTWANGETGAPFGDIRSSNSLIGSTAFDKIGSDLDGATSVHALPNGNYVVRSPMWDCPGFPVCTALVPTAGAVSWGAGDGTSLLNGAISGANSLIGSSTGDTVGYLPITVLSNGNYVIPNPLWRNGPFTNAGAATWADGDTGIKGQINAGNSLLGSTTNDLVGGAVVALTNGNYVVSSPVWDNGGIVNVGASTFGNGETGISGVVSTENSLVGSNLGDSVGLPAIALPNGSYVVPSPFWKNGVNAQAGALTWGNGATGITGVVSGANSLVGGTAGDMLGLFSNDGVNPPAISVTALPNSEYVVHSLYHDGVATDSGALSLGNRKGSTRGAVTSDNSVLGTIASGGTGITWDFNPVHQWVAVAGHDTNLVTIIFYTEELTVSKDGTGSGAVTSTPAAIDCGAICTAGIGSGTVVTLTATPDPSSTFTGWSGDCTGTGMCSVTMTQARNVTATFARKSYALTVNTAGTGTGAVSGAPANPIAHGTVVTLTATADAGSVFSGWSGDCTGTGACVVTMTQTRNVTAAFAKTYTLTVNTAGTGSGTVSGAPANPIAHGTVVTLSATADVGSIFAGWSGDCAGAGACIVTMVAAKTVTATFTLQGGNEVEVDVSPAGAGGMVAVEVITDTVAAGAALMPVRVAATEEAYPVGTVLRLTALPYLGYVFDGWGGHVSGTLNPLEVVVTQPLVVTAAFVVADVFLPAVGR